MNTNWLNVKVYVGKKREMTAEDGDEPETVESSADVDFSSFVPKYRHWSCNFDKNVDPLSLFKPPSEKTGCLLPLSQ